MSPNTVIGILKYKQQLDQDNAARAAEAQSNLPDSRPRSTGTYGTLANAVSSNISGQPVSMQNPPVAGGEPKPNYSPSDDVPSEIQQYPDTLPQLDKSNLAGPVPTDLTPPPGYGQRPRLVTGVPVEEGAASPIGYNGGQLLNPADYSYLNPPAQPGFDKTRGGMTRPDLQTYEQSLNAKGEHIGRMARFGAGFKQGVRGGLVNGLIGGVVDLANPGAGNKAVYETDTGEFDQQKQAELAQERADPMYQRQLESQQLRMDQPIRLQTYQAQQQAELARQSQLANINNSARMNQIAARGLNTVDAIQARASFKANGDLDAARAFYSGAANPDTGKRYTPAEVDQLARNDVSEIRDARLEKLWGQAESADATTDLRKAQMGQADATTTLREKQAANVGQGKPANGLTANKSLDVDLKPIDDEIKGLARDESDLKRQLNGHTITQTQYNQRLAEIAAKQTDAHTRREGVVNQHRGGQAGAAGGLTPQQETDFQARKAKYPALTRQQYLDIINKLKQ